MALFYYSYYEPINRQDGTRTSAKQSFGSFLYLLFIEYFQRYKHNKKDLQRSLLKNGGCGGTRTHDQLIKSQLRYQLRHAPIYI